MINRQFFFDTARLQLFDGKLKASQIEGITGILDQWESAHAKKDDRWLAYMLATTHHETDRTMRPIEEYGKGKGRPYGVPDPTTGHVYYGRGFVQLTWMRNYATMSSKVGVDLVSHPERALDLTIATRILFLGMFQGLFTGKMLSDYLDPGRENWREARRIINGLDKADLIGSYGKRYYAAISYTT